MNPSHLNVNLNDLYSLKAVCQHLFHDAKQKGNPTKWPLLALGAVTMAVGLKMIYDVSQMQRKKDDRLKSWVERCAGGECDVRGSERER